MNRQTGTSSRIEIKKVLDMNGTEIRVGSTVEVFDFAEPKNPVSCGTALVSRVCRHRGGDHPTISFSIPVQGRYSRMVDSVKCTSCKVQ